MFVEVADIKRALDCDEIVPTFQPQVHLHDGKLVGFEVLARWAHAEQGLILPGNFIALAESTGSIDALTEQVLRKSLAAASSLAEPVTLSVNVSPVQLRDAGLPLLIRRIGEAYRFPFNRLTIEITETALLDNLAEAKSVAAELKAMGCKLSLDDFGTGYSSLHHLRSLPFDELKIDRSFVSSMTSERESRKIVAATVSLGRSLGLTTVGEGVEEASQSGMLTALGCHVGQGWLYGRPQPAERLEETIGMVRAIPMSEIAGGGFDLVSCSLEAMPEQRLAQLQAIYDGAPVCRCFLDANLRYVSLNQRLAELNGRPVAEHLGHHVREMVPHLYPKIEKYLLRALDGEPTNEVEIFRRAMGHGQRDRALLASYQPMLDEAGEVTGVLIAMVDITARKRAESALRRRNAQTRMMGISAFQLR